MRILDPNAWPSKTEIDGERMRRDFTRFVKAAWEHADPAPLVWGWHLDALCQCLQAVTEKKIDNLLINIPPGHAKSMIVSVLWPAWRWTRDPKWSGMFASYELGLVMRDAVKARSLIKSDWYIDHFVKVHRGPQAGSLKWDFEEDQDTKKLYKTTEGGMRQATSVGLGTGYRGDTLVVDDPTSVDQSYSEVELEAATRWFFETMPTRFNDMQSAQRVVIMQRLHERDVSGEILSREPAQWQHLLLPAQFNPDERAVVKAKDGTVIFSDPRTVKGELLFPAKFPASVVAGLRKSLGPYGSSGQLDQRPSPIGGGMLRAEWFARRWTLPGERVREGNDPVCGVPLSGVPVPLPLSHLFMVTDAAFKGTDKSDRVAVGVWGFHWPNLYLVDLVWDQMTFTETLQAMKALAARWKVRDILVEEAANGAAIINTLSQDLPAVLAITPEGSKVARILASAPYLAAGNVIYPARPAFSASPRGNIATIEALIAEASAFPRGRNDDGIDMQAYAVNKYLADQDLSALMALGQATSNPQTVSPVNPEIQTGYDLASLRGLTLPGIG